MAARTCCAHASTNGQACTATENHKEGDIDQENFRFQRAAPRLCSGNGAYGAYIVFAEVPFYEGPSAAKAIHFAACAAANFEIKTKTGFQADSLLPGELELSYY
jgi:hypothetical protein